MSEFGKRAIRVVEVSVPHRGGAEGEPRQTAHRHLPGGTFLGAELLHGAGKAEPRFTTELTEVTENSPPVCLRVLRALCGEWLFGGLPRHLPAG